MQNNDNFLTIQQEMQWLEGRFNAILRWKPNQFIEHPPAMLSPDPPTIEGVNTVYAQFIKQNRLTVEDRLLLALAMVPHCQLDLLARLRRIKKMHPLTGSFIKSASLDYWLPSGLTYTHLYAHLHETKAYQGANFLHRQSVLINQGVVAIGAHLAGEPALSGVLALRHDYWLLLTENSTQLDLLNLQTTNSHA